MTILSDSSSRIEGLKKALQAEDDTVGRQFNMWAIRQLAVEDSEVADNVLLEYVLNLQERAPEKGSGFKGRNADGYSFADMVSLYHATIRAMREMGWTDEELTAAGVMPREYYYDPLSPTP